MAPTRAPERGKEIFNPHFLLTHAVPLLGQYGYAVILPIAVIEGPAMAMVAGALVAAGSLNAYAAAVLLVLADLVGDALYYSLGRFGHAPLLQRVSDRLSLHPERFKSLEQKFHDHDWKLILIGKTQAFGSIILYFAGASRMSFLRYLALNLVGTVPKVILFEAAGYFLGGSILHSTRYIDYVTVAMFAIALVLIATFWLVRRRLSRDLMQDT